MVGERQLAGKGSTMIAKDFVMAGNSIFTVEIPAQFAEKHQSPAHYTYRVRHKEAEGTYPEAWFVELLTGPENTSDYTYLGKLLPEGKVKLTAKSRYGEDAMPVRLLDRILARLWKNEGAAIEQAGFKLHHEGRCGRCGRLLTVPESIETGIGPECRKMMAA